MINKLFLFLGISVSVVSVKAQNQFLDPSFGTNGVVSYTPNSNNRFIYETGAVTSQQKIIVSGTYYSIPNNNQTTTNVIQRLNADGTIDNSFNTLFISPSPYGPLSRLLRMGIQSDQKILLGDVLGNKLIRLNENGTYDTGFGNNGTVDGTILDDFVSNLGMSGLFNFNNVLVTNTNKVLVCSSIVENQVRKLAVLRLNENGSIDMGFGNNGILLMESDSGRLVVQNDSKLVLIGQKFNGIFMKSRYSEDGILDTTYNNNPISYTPIPNYVTYLCTVTGKDNNTYIYSFSSAAGIPTMLITLMKLDQNGELDNSFGTNGIVNEVYYNNNTSYYVDTNILFPTLLLDNASNLFLICTASPTGNAADTNQFIKKFKPDGSVDQGFGSNGVVDIDLNGKEYMNSAILTPDQKIMVFGNYQTPVKGLITKILNNTNALSVKEERSKIESVGIYPNPVKNILHINSGQTKNLDAEITDAAGRSILRTGIKDNKLNVDELQKGIYYLKIGNTTHKFIKE
ncbi:T9SS type A sorting domain-containing protein [Chryseobacterium arthrosphaerae]|uniref:T9SS type A sorting domain-containing protein n=1 Tax=Chryseobacterium arthrosphaerae TaxID=651561 RepID=UPI001BAFC603|nr:T9SS type A sorting domain-containing protein [Chryseobacterium arthrosphaerae]QUY54756.1 T9SS type A sorting domain-containing protein [Chryseobacterium arthrosphaerae]